MTTKSLLSSGMVRLQYRLCHNFRKVASCPTELKIVSKHLYSFQRSSTWIAPTPGLTAPRADDPKLDKNLQYLEEEREKFEDPQYLLAHRKAIYHQGCQNFRANLLGTPTQVEAIKIFTETMKQRLNHQQEIIDHIIPDFPVGCRRNTPGPGFLEALVKENVTVITTSIEMITPKGLRLTDGREIECDVLVCATGFDATFRPRFPLIGRGERSLSEEWTANPPDAYLGIAVSGYPNYFSKYCSRILAYSSFYGPQYTRCQWHSSWLCASAGRLYVKCLICSDAF